MEDTFIGEGYFRILIGLITTPIIFMIFVILLVVTLVQKYFDPFIIGMILFLMIICVVTFFVLLHFWKKNKA